MAIKVVCLPVQSSMPDMKLFYWNGVCFLLNSIQRSDPIRHHSPQVIGREREVSRTIQILARRTKNNPILLGEPGVGKTAIAEGLALAIVTRSNPDGSPLPTFLHSKRVMQLDVGLIIAGAKERGELENRVTKLIQEVKDSGNVILM